MSTPSKFDQIQGALTGQQIGFALVPSAKEMGALWAARFNLSSNEQSLRAALDVASIDLLDQSGASDAWKRERGDPAAKLAQVSICRPEHLTSSGHSTIRLYQTTFSFKVPATMIWIHVEATFDEAARAGTGKIVSVTAAAN